MFNDAHNFLFKKTIALLAILCLMKTDRLLLPLGAGEKWL